MSPEPEDSSSLHFLSTQIQSRYDDDIENDRNASILQKFKHPTPTFEPPPEKITKRAKKNPKPSKKSNSKGKKPTSLSAFVRETLGNPSKANTQSILDFFSGERAKAESFLGRIEAATAKPHPLSKSRSSSLFSESEWRSFLDSVKLKFPSLSRTNHKTLKILTKRVHEMRQRDKEDDVESSQDLDMWSQASRQPSDQLSAEDMKWLYDLDEEQVVNDVSEVYEEEEEGKEFFVTLSQVLDGEREGNEEGIEEENEEGIEEGNQEDNEDKIEEQSEEEKIKEDLRTLPLVLVPDSESEPEELDPEELSRFELSQNLQSQKVEQLQVLSLSQLSPPKKSVPTSQIPSHQVPESLDILTSISFAPTYKNELRTAKKDTEIMSSPPKLAEFKTPQHIPNFLAITSSPPSKSDREKSQVDSQFLSPVKYSPEEFSTAPTGLEEAATDLSRQSLSRSELSSEHHGTPTRSNRSTTSQKSGIYSSSRKSSRTPQPAELSQVFPERLLTPTPVKTQRSSCFRSPTQDSDFSVHISPIKRKSYVTSTVEVYGKVEFQSQMSKMRNSKLRFSKLPEVSLEDIIPDSEDDEGEVSIIEISREIPNLDRQRSVLQVPSSP